MELNIKNLPDTIELIESPTEVLIFRIKENQLVFSLSDIKFTDTDDTDLTLNFEYIILRNPNNIIDDDKLKDQLGHIVTTLIEDSIS